MLDDVVGRPDFASLYRNSSLAPRMAARLWIVAGCAHDDFRDDNADMWIEMLPRSLARHYDERFVAAFGTRFDVLRQSLAVGVHEPELLGTCTADEMALHLVIDIARDLHADDLLDQPWVEALPPRSEEDEDFTWLEDILFQDADVLLLFDPSLDGIEDPESDLAQSYRVVNLHPDAWFTRF